MKDALSSVKTKETRGRKHAVLSGNHQPERAHKQERIYLLEF